MRRWKSHLGPVRLWGKTGQSFPCPACSNDVTTLRDGRQMAEGYVRVRRCNACEHTFHTIEILRDKTSLLVSWKDLENLKDEMNEIAERFGARLARFVDESPALHWWEHEKRMRKLRKGTGRKPKSLTELPDEARQDRSPKLPRSSRTQD